MLPKLKILCIYGVVLSAILLAVVTVRLNSFAKVLDVSVLDLIRPLPDRVLQDKSVTILLLGVGGEGHEGPYLTDSISLVRYTPHKNRINTLGIPRDLWDPEIKDRINSIYTYALQQKDVTPYTYTKGKFNNLLKTRIDYVVVINFADFEQLIDLIGGIKIHLDTGFVDPTFPIAGAENTECEPYDPDYGCRYQTLVFREGDLKLNGSIALKFVRSRHADGEAGSDFSRNARQQMVIAAIKMRIYELLKERNFDKLLAITVFLDTHIKRDIPNKEALSLTREAIQRQGSLRVGSTTLTEDALEVPSLDEYEGRYVLVPLESDYKKLQKDLEKLLNQGT